MVMTSSVLRHTHIAKYENGTSSRLEVNVQSSAIECKIVYPNIVLFRRYRTLFDMRWLIKFVFLIAVAFSKMYFWMALNVIRAILHIFSSVFIIWATSKVCWSYFNFLINLFFFEEWGLFYLLIYHFFASRILQNYER